MKKIELHLHILEIRLNEDSKIVSPLYLPEIVRINTSPKNMVSQLYTIMHQKLLKQGDYDTLLKYLLAESLRKGKIKVELDTSQEGLFPHLELNFDFFYLKTENKQYIGYIPALSIESAGESLKSLKENLTENVRLEFIRMERLKSIPSIISTQWFEQIELHSLPQSFSFYTLGELDKIQEQSKQNILPEVGQRLSVDIKERELYGLENELEQIQTSMKVRHRNSLIVVGGAGKGKTALIKEFVRQKDKIGLTKVSVWEVSAAQLIHRLSGMGSWEQYLAEVCQELRRSRDILYVNNFSELFEVGQYIGNSMSIADYLRDYVSRGEVTLLTECSPEEALQIELRSPGYLALFTNIKIPELTRSQIQHIVNQKINQLGEKKLCVVEENAVQEILRLQQWYTPYSELPGKTIHFLSSIISDKEKQDIKIVDKPAIFERFCQETGMPEFMINPEIALDVKSMEVFFQKNIYGQEEAIETVLDVLVAIKAAVVRRGKPLASLLFVGPTGVGKTEMAKVLAQFMFGKRSKMIRFDMSEYSDLQAVMRLTGDSYTGEGLLTASVRQEPFSVILFDELEKVHPSFYDLLLQILGEGRLTDARGRVADFCSTIIIMTSNIGARSFQTGSIGFVETLDEKSSASAHFKSKVQAYFRPELFNRLDRVIAFAPLQREVVRKIIDREMVLIKRREGIKGRNVEVEIAKEVLDYLGVQGYNSAYGARFLQRTVQEQLVIPLSRQLNTFYFHTAIEVQVYMEDKKITFDIKQRLDVNIADRAVDDQDNVLIYDFVRIGTSFRRQASLIENGNYYAKFLSRIDQLERKLKKFKRVKKEKAFWKNERQQKTYHSLKDLQQKFAVAFEEIKAVEANNFLLLNDVKLDEKALYKHFKVWRKNFMALKARLVELENAEFNTCSMGIYGNSYEIFEFAELYQKFAEEHSLSIDLKTVWYHTKEKLYYRKPYIKYLGENHTLVGIQIQFRGKLAYLYFKNEDSVHVWAKKQQKFTIYVAPVTTDKLFIPSGIHRKNFFDNAQVRRIYGLKDLREYNYNKTFHTNEHAKHLSSMLEDEFLRNVDDYLLGNVDDESAF